MQSKQQRYNVIINKKCKSKIYYANQKQKMREVNSDRK